MCQLQRLVLDQSLNLSSYMLKQEAPGQLRLPWSKQRLQDKKAHDFFSKPVQFFGKKHLVWTHMSKSTVDQQTNIGKLLRTVGWQPLSSKGAEVTHYGETYQDVSKFPYLKQPSGPQSVFSIKGVFSVFSLSSYILVLRLRFHIHFDIYTQAKDSKLRQEKLQFCGKCPILASSLFQKAGIS